ncbi:hypothetical protein [Corallococcus exiguus]|uniref:hypothetical protein n=1 Tax=Corallococcus exiguus TaxID=83462 RepID=UPI00156047B5|nr:hypothetical protein [Corallococcus exiguus]NRD47441.1 hypothetical protein [Corallococcus exiguus]
MPGGLRDAWCFLSPPDGSLLGRHVSDAKLPAALKKLRLATKLPKPQGKLKDPMRGITVSKTK